MASLITIPDLIFQARTIVSRTFGTGTVFFFTMLVYLVLSQGIARSMRRLERRLTHGRASLTSLLVMLGGYLAALLLGLIFFALYRAPAITSTTKAWADRAHIRHMRGKVGMVFQQFNLFPHMTALENVASAPQHVLGMSRQQAREQSLTMLVVTHQLGVARAIADCICFMDQGVVVEQGTPRAFFETPQNPRTRAFLSAVQLS